MPVVRRASVGPSFCLSDLWTRYLKNRFTNRLQFWNIIVDHLKYGRYWFLAMCENQDGRHLVNAISLEPLNQSTSHLVYDVISPKGWTLLILGHVQKLRWPPLNFLICMLYTPLVNAISLEPRNQSTSDLVYDVIPPKGRTLLILGHLLKTRWPLLNFWNICTVVKIMLVNAIYLKPFPQSTSNLKFVFILSIGQVVLILGHLLKPRWPLSWFKKWL